MEVFLFAVLWSKIILSISLENLAFNKSSTQSSNLHEDKWLADAAVDGNGNQSLTGNSCSCTDYFKPTVWWKVNLGDVYAISNVNIFYRDEGTLFRLSGFKLYVTIQNKFTSSTPVYVDNNGIQGLPYPLANFTVRVASYGQYVTLYKDRSYSCVGNLAMSNPNYCALFELCEIEVSGCPKTKFGTSCQSDCPENCLYNICAVSDGKCYGCKAGYTGDMCDQYCMAGTFGMGCLQTCSDNCKGGATCDVRNGTCPSGCLDGYKGAYCNQTCSPGSYGSSCSSTCGSCRNHVTCNYLNGSCPNGCGLGVTGPYCKTPCRSGNYGENCIGKCSGNCLNDLACNVQSGHCDNGCSAGWKGNECSTVCSSGEYGPNCQHNCNGNCQNETVCSRIDGSCQYGCKQGWKGKICNRVCESGSYGSDCKETCGKCINNTICDRKTGACKHGCADGYKGSVCRERCSIGFYGPNCSLKCIKCISTCDYVTGECPVSEPSETTAIQNLKLPFIIYGVISSVIICISAALNICFLRQVFSFRSENNINKNDFELSEPDKQRSKGNSGDGKNPNSGDANKKVLKTNQKSKIEKYETLGHFHGDKSNYETLKKEEQYMKPQDIQTKTLFTTMTTDDETDDKKYEELHTDTAENNYESLRN